MPYTCGELAQGFWQGEHVVISAPINRYAVAVAVPVPDEGKAKKGAGTGGRAGNAGERGGWRPVSAAFAKSAAALALAGDKGWLAGTGYVFIHSPLPRAKGFGTSTADAGAAVQAAAAACATPVSAEQLGLLLAALEPTDGSMHHGLAVFNSRTGRLCMRLPAPPPIAVGIFDWGGEVDTQQYHRQSRAATSSRLDEAISAISTGLRHADPVALGWGATQSALAHQAVLPKPGLEILVQIAAAHHSYGVCIAHTGTIGGVIAPPGYDWADLRKACQVTLPALRWLGEAAMIGGGSALWQPKGEDAGTWQAV